MRWLAASLCLLACGGPVAPDAGTDAGVDAGGPVWFAGVATVDITPAPGIEIVGYGTRVATEVRDPLEAAVLLLRREDARAALVTIDLPGISDWAAAQVRGRVASATAIPYDAVIVATSHTHSAPMLGDDAWSARSMDAIGEAAGRAALEPVTLALGEGAIAFDVNRRRVVDGVAEIGPDPDGPHDPRVRTLVLDGADGPVAIVSHLACHPNLLLGEESTRVSADFPGEARARLVARHGAPWLVLMGAAGDIRPDVAFVDGAFRLAEDADLERLGAELADAVEVGIAAAAPIDGPLAVARETWHAPTRTEERRALDLAAWRLGPLAVVTMPGEPLVEVGLETEDALRSLGPEHALVVGYANGYVGYLVAPRDEPFGGYEVSRSRLSGETTLELERRVVGLAGRLF